MLKKRWIFIAAVSGGIGGYVSWHTNHLGGVCGLAQVILGAAVGLFVWSCILAITYRRR